jgi:hypothetical protein
MFKRIAKEQQRFVSSIQRGGELSVALDLALLNLVALKDIAIGDLLEEDNLKRLAENLAHTSKYRDETTKLNLHAECSVFSLNHLQTFQLLVSARLAQGLEIPMNLNKFGCAHISSLNSDVRYLSWGVKAGTISNDLYWEASDFLNDYKARARERLTKAYPDDLVPFNKIGSGDGSQSVAEFCKLFDDPFSYWVPPRH